MILIFSKVSILQSDFLWLCNGISWIISRSEHRTVGLQPTLSPDGRAREALTLSIDLQHLFSEGFALLYISRALRNVCLTLFPCKCTFNVFLLSSPYKTISHTFIDILKQLQKSATKYSRGYLVVFPGVYI